MSLIVGVFGVDGAETLNEAVVLRRIILGVGVAAAAVGVAGGNPFVFNMMVDGVGTEGVCLGGFVVDEDGFVTGFAAAAAAAAATRFVLSLSLTSIRGLSPLPLMIAIVGNVVLTGRWGCSVDYEIWSGYIDLCLDDSSQSVQKVGSRVNSIVLH